MHRLVLLASLALLPGPVLAQGPVLTLEGQVRRPGPRDTTALARFGADTLTHAVRGTPARFRGVLLWRLLTEAGLATDSTVKNDALRKVVVASAPDGYRIVFSVGELDPGLGGTGVLVAWERDGELLGERGPFQLIVPGDRRPARSIHQLDRLEVTAP